MRGTTQPCGISHDFIWGIRTIHRPPYLTHFRKYLRSFQHPKSLHRSLLLEDLFLPLGLQHLQTSLFQLFHPRLVATGGWPKWIIHQNIGITDVITSQIFGSDAIWVICLPSPPGPSPRGRRVKTTGTAVLPTPVGGGAGGGGKCLSPTLHHYQIIISFA